MLFCLIIKPHQQTFAPSIRKDPREGLGFHSAQPLPSWIPTPLAGHLQGHPCPTSETSGAAQFPPVTPDGPDPFYCLLPSSSLTTSQPWTKRTGLVRPLCGGSGASESSGVIKRKSWVCSNFPSPGHGGLCCAGIFHGSDRDLAECPCSEGV